MSKKINQLDALNSTEAKSDSQVLAQADPTTGLAKKITVAQMKEVYSTKKITYTANGTEGTTLTIPSLEGYMILLIIREQSPLHEVGATPNSVEFTWDDTDIGLGAATNPGERFLILYRTY